MFGIGHFDKQRAELWAEQRRNYGKYRIEPTGANEFRITIGGPLGWVVVDIPLFDTREDAENWIDERVKEEKQKELHKKKNPAYIYPLEDD